MKNFFLNYWRSYHSHWACISLQQTWKSEFSPNILLRFSCDSRENYNRKFAADSITRDLLKNYHERRLSNFEEYRVVSKIEACFRDSFASIEFRIWRVHQHEWTNSMFENRKDELRHDENVSNLELKISQQIISTHKNCLWTIWWFRILVYIHCEKLRSRCCMCVTYQKQKQNRLTHTKFERKAFFKFQFFSARFTICFNNVEVKIDWDKQTFDRCNVNYTEL